MGEKSTESSDTETYFPESMLRPYSTWRHEKTASTYTVFGVSTCSTNGSDGGKKVVVYISHTGQHLRHHDLNEFLDGRFVPLLPK